MSYSKPEETWPGGAMSWHIYHDGNRLAVIPPFTNQFLNKTDAYWLWHILSEALEDWDQLERMKK